MNDSSSHSRTPSEGADGAWSGPLLALALILGLLRFWKLGDWSLWVDEAHTVADWGASLDLGRIWNPLGYVAIRETVALLGGELSEWTLRFLPALVGWLCIPIAYWAFAGSFGRRRAAWVAILIAVSSWHVYWSQTARFYTFAMAFSLVGGGLLLRGVDRGRVLLALLGLLVAGLAAAFHPTAALLVPALTLAPILVALRTGDPSPHFARVRTALLVCCLLGALAAAPWAWSSIQNHQAQKGTADLLAGPVHLLLTLGYFFTPVVVVAALIGAVWSWRERDRAGLMAAWVCLISLGAALFLSLSALMTAQYTFCVLPWALAAAVSPLEASVATRRARAAGTAWGALLVVSALASLMLYMTSRMGERPRWREAYELVDRLREPGDLILGMATPVGEVYLGERGTDPRRPLVVSPLGDWFPDGPRRWNRHPRRIWAVVRPQWYESLRPGDRAMLEDWLREECRLVQRYPVAMEGRDLEVLVYLRDR